MDKTNIFYLKMASHYANQMSGCVKVKVGSCIVKNDSIVAFGSNRTMPNLCKHKGCLRVEKYGNNFKAHRNPDDCRAIHSEVDAIGNAVRNGVNLSGSTIYVTRYPCENCARLIVTSGIKHVVYGRQQEISRMSSSIFESAGVSCYSEKEYLEEDIVV